MAGFLSPKEVVKNFDLEPGDHVADFGTGHGYFVLPLARAVGAKGKIYAIDVQKSVLEVIRAQAKTKHLSNVEPIWADLEHPAGLPIPENFIDLVLLANTLFQTENKMVLLQQAYRLLRKSRKFAIIEWDGSSAPLGPPLGMRVNKERLKSACEKIGFRFVKEFPAGNHHYGLLFQKK